MLTFKEVDCKMNIFELKILIFIDMETHWIRKYCIFPHAKSIMEKHSGLKYDPFFYLMFMALWDCPYECNYLLEYSLRNTLAQY